MKKILAISILMLFVACGSCLAAEVSTGNITSDQGQAVYGGSDTTQAATDNNLLGKCSKGVRAGFAYDSTHYAINTKHDQGNKAFGTSYDSTAIYNTDLGTGALTAAPSAQNESAFSSWTQM